MLAGADELPALQRGRGHGKGAGWLCAYVCLAGCSHALTVGGNKESGMNCAGELQRHQCLWLPPELLAEGTVGWFISELTSLMQRADHHHLP